MIKENMFFGERTLKEYRDISLMDVIREFLLSKGTWRENGIPSNLTVAPRDLVDSALFVYGLKYNSTNRKAMEYYCERKAREEQIMRGSTILIPTELWEDCDRHNREFTHRKKNEQEP
ncbi:MAG: hypothetical protein IJM04_04205 [Prevotella sp.]|nr:hypothetical protein [Prevotella sp.]